MKAESFGDYANEMMPSLVRTARAVTGEVQLADDVLQAVLERLCRRWSKISQLQFRDAYVKRMVVNEFLDQVKGRRRIVLLPDPADEATNPHLRDSRQSDPYWRSDEQAALIELIRQLPAQQRVVVGLRFYAELSDSEIADAMGCRPGTVRGYLSRALASLRVTYVPDLESQEH